MLAASSLAGVNCFTNITSPCVPPTIPDYICPGNNESTIYVQENQSSGYWNKKSSIMTCNWICYPNSGEGSPKTNQTSIATSIAYNWGCSQGSGT
jgi:hypothetical protein